MNVSVSDIHQTLEYRVDTAVVRLLPIGLALCFLSLFVFALNDRPSAEIIFAGCVVLVAGLGLIWFALWRRSNPGEPLFVLSPMGIFYRTAKGVLIPWREIKGIDTIDIRTWNWSIRHSGTLKLDGVTVVLVSKEFYDSHIFIDSLFLRGPGWRIKFIPKGSLIQIALHHEIVSVERQALRQAVEARWHAFRGQPAGSTTGDDKSVKSKRTSVPRVTAAWRRMTGRSDAAARPSPTLGIAAGDNPRAMSTWEAVQIIVPLIGIAVVLSNLLGLWATPRQTKAREERKKWEELDRRRQEDMKRLEEEQKKRDKVWQEFFRRP